MSDLAIREVITIGNDDPPREVVVRELTPALLRKLLVGSSLSSVPTDEEGVARMQIDAWLFEDCRLSDLVAFTDLTIEQVEALPPSQLKVIKKKVKDLNPDFFSALGRMAAVRSGH